MPEKHSVRATHGGHLHDLLRAVQHCDAPVSVTLLLSPSDREGDAREHLDGHVGTASPPRLHA